MSEEKPAGEIVEEVEFEMPNPYADINAACNAIDAVDALDGSLIGRAKKIEAIRRMSVDIIFEQIKYLHTCLYDDEVDE